MLFGIFSSWVSGFIVKLIVFIVCWCIGSALGNIARAHRKEGVGLIAGWFGVTLGLVFTKVTGIDNTMVFWLVLIGLGALFAFVSMAMEGPIVILSTSFIGAFLIIAGVALLCGKYDELAGLNTKNMTQNQTGFLIGLVAIAGVAAFKQNKEVRK